MMSVISGHDVNSTSYKYSNNLYYYVYSHGYYYGYYNYHVYSKQDKLLSPCYLCSVWVMWTAVPLLQ